MLKRFWLRLRCLGRVLLGRGVMFRATLYGPVYFPDQDLLITQSTFRGDGPKPRLIVANKETA